MYMILYYDSWIRATVVKCWDEDSVPGLEPQVEVNIPENEIEPHESYSLRDPKIPISYKKAIAQKLYEAESEVVKAEVRRQREVWRENGTTIHTEDKDERKVLVREYQRCVYSLSKRYPQSNTLFSRNIPALSRNIGTVLRNAERKCAAKGIVWLSCPSPSRGGQPVAFLSVFLYSFCSPLLTQSAFPANAQEVLQRDKSLKRSLAKRRPKNSRPYSQHGFTRYIVRCAFHRTSFELLLIFPIAPSEWPFYSLGESTSDGPSTASNLEQDNEEDIDADIDAQQPDPATATLIDMQQPDPATATLIDVQQLDPVAATLTNVTPSAVSTIPLQPTTTHPAALPEINITTSTLPSGLPPPSDLHAALANQDQGVLDPKISNHLDHCITRSNDPLTTIDDLPTSATESAWMKSKKTLKYFREAHKMGRLSDLILHWYQLEEVLGFQETVSFLLPKLRENLLMPTRPRRAFHLTTGHKSFERFSRMATTTRRTTDSKQSPLVPRLYVGGRRSRLLVA